MEKEAVVVFLTICCVLGMPWLMAQQEDTDLSGGVLLPFQVFPMKGGNWEGDGNTWGGIDSVARYSADLAAVICHSDGSPQPSSYEIDCELNQDFGSADVLLRAGVRCGPTMCGLGQIYWGDALVLECSPFLDGAELPVGRDSVLRVFEKRIAKGEIDLKKGRHTIRFRACATPDFARGWFQVDAISIEALPPLTEAFCVPLQRFFLTGGDSLDEDPIREAWRHFRARAESLGASATLEQGDVSGACRVTLERVSESVFLEKIPERTGWNGLSQSMKEESYCIDLDADSSVITVSACGGMGLVYGLCDLERRIRADDGRVYVSFPEWVGGRAISITEVPALEQRGEYLNIGYNFSGITPHDWSRDRWESYIDRLVLANLNTFYFYIWVDSYSMNPKSALAQKDLSRKIHEDIRHAIAYAHKRGLKVVYMFCPTFFPRDLWERHPEIHADIEYVKQGFPAVCPNAPNAWEMMIENARAEMEWFNEADAVQLWFYDPGGCWCERHGCKQHQAESLARQAKTFGALFREFNPKAAIEVNFWPIWLWETLQQVNYRAETFRLIRGHFGEEASAITVVGAPDNDITQPLAEQEMGFKTSVFLFGTNPERGYVFTIPTMSWLSQVAKEVRNKKFRGAFGHRLEAWTRYPQTFFMGQWFWNPDQTAEQLAQRLGAWLTASDSRGLLAAEAFLLLDKFTYEGADKLLGRRMTELIVAAYQGTPAPAQEDWEYIPPMMSALAVLAESKGVEENAALQCFVDRFAATLGETATFQSIRQNAESVFNQYRGYLLKGWAKEIF